VTDRQYDNAMRGVLFTNDRRESDNHPHYQGSCEINSVQYWLSGWVKEPKAGGNDFVSIVLRRKDDPKDAPRPPKDDPNLRGALFINERKDADDKPDYTGRCQVDDVTYWLNAWIKAPRQDGEDFISIKFELSGTRSTGRVDAKTMLARARGRHVSKDASTGSPPKGDDFDDDIPF
jgi:uncharacterized protein (DUF736 family)